MLMAMTLAALATEHNRNDSRVNVDTDGDNVVYMHTCRYYVYVVAGDSLTCPM